MIKIAVESNSELKQGAELIDALVPITVTIDGKDYLSGVNLDNDFFYESLINSKEFPTTSQPSPQLFAELYEECRDQGDDLIVITLSSVLSGTYQSACMAKEMVGYDRVFIVNTMTISHPIWYLVKIANDMRANGKTAEEIFTELEDIKHKVKVVAAVDTLDFLHRSGRLSKTAATLGSMASLKPILSVKEDGTLGVLGKALGKGKAMQFIINKLKEANIDSDYPVFSLYSYGTENCEELEKLMIKEGFNFKERRQIGPSVGAHVGPGSYGAVFITR